MRIRAESLTLTTSLALVKFMLFANKPLVALFVKVFVLMLTSEASII